MHKILLILLALMLTAPQALARRTDMMSSYGFSKEYKNKAARQYRDNRYKYIYKYHDPGDIYLGKQDRYIGDRYRSKAGRMLYEDQHYRNYVDRNRYLRERRKLDLEERRRKLEEGDD